MGEKFREWLTVLFGRYRSMRALARELNVTETSVMAWRDGRSLPSEDLEGRLAELAGEEPDRLRELIRAARIERAQIQRRRWLAAPEVAALPGQFRPKEGFTTGGIAAVADPKGSRAGQRTRPITRTAVKPAETRRMRRILLSWPGWPLAA